MVTIGDIERIERAKGLGQLLNDGDVVDHGQAVCDPIIGRHRPGRSEG